MAYIITLFIAVFEISFASRRHAKALASFSFKTGS